MTSFRDWLEHRLKEFDESNHDMKVPIYRDLILSELSSRLPKEKKVYEAYNAQGYNQAVREIRERLGLE